MRDHYKGCIAMIKPSLKNEFTVKVDQDASDEWSFEKYLRDNQQRFNLRAVARVPQKEVKTNFATGLQETVEFELVLMSSGASVKGSYTVSPGSGGGGGSSQKGSTLTLDLSNVNTEAEAREAFERFQDILLSRDSQNHPAGKKLEYFTQGGGQWNELGNKIKIEKLQDVKMAQKFIDRGIDVYVNGQKIIDASSKLKNEPPQARKPKPWDIPTVPGAPRPTPDKK